MPEGAYRVIARNVRGNTYVDTRVTSGRLYRYVVSGGNESGEGPDSVEGEVGAGPPAPWAHRDVGGVSVPGDSAFDGSILTLEGAGTDIGGDREEFQFAYRPWPATA